MTNRSFPKDFSQFPLTLGTAPPPRVAGVSTHSHSPAAGSLPVDRERAR